MYTKLKRDLLNAQGNAQYDQHAKNVRKRLIFG